MRGGVTLLLYYVIKYIINLGSIVPDRTTGDQLIIVEVTDQRADEYVVKQGR